MRVLLLTPDPPAVTHANGGATRQLRLYRHLIEQGHEVTVVAPFVPRSPDPVNELVGEGFAVRPYVRPKSRVLEVVRAVASKPSLLLAPFRLSFQEIVAAIYWTRLRTVVEATIDESNFDVVCIEQQFAAGWISEIPKGLARVVVVQQVESSYRRDRAMNLTGIRRRLWLIEAARAEQSERRWIPQFDALVCMSQSEIDLLAEHVDRLPPVSIVGNGAEVASLADVGADPDRGIVLFTGTLAFKPNEVAAVWLATEVWPLVLAAAPDASLQIVGRAPRKVVRDLAGLPNVTVHADVPDMRIFLERASVCTLPMLEGGGTRLKLAEAFSAKRAVVATSNGATGLDVRDGIELVIADGAEGFANAIVRLLGDEFERRRLAAQAHAFAEKELDWSELGGRFEHVLEKAVNAIARE